MGFDRDIKKMLMQVLKDCNGNKAAASEKLGINSVTFWSWMNGKRKPVQLAIASAIDKAGAHLVFKSETIENLKEEVMPEIYKLELENNRLKLEKEELENKLSIERAINARYEGIIIKLTESNRGKN